MARETPSTNQNRVSTSSKSTGRRPTLKCSSVASERDSRVAYRPVNMMDKQTPDSSSDEGGRTAEEKTGEHTVTIYRKAYCQAQFDEDYVYEKDGSGDSLLGAMGSYFFPGEYTLAERALSLFPVISIMRMYRWKEWLMYDMISGISVGVIHIPQGMAFALLAGLPAVYGLYSSLFPVICYFIFGTSRHISFGTMAVISLFIVSVVDRETDRYATLTKDFSDANVWPHGKQQIENMKVGVACAVSLLAGIIQCLMGSLRLGIVASFMSTPFISGFMTGAGFHITSSQLKSLLGLKLPKIEQGIAYIPRTIINIGSHINEVNVAELIITGACMVLLTFLKEYVNVKFAKQLKVPIPAELIAVGISILISYLLDLHGNYGVNIIGHVPSGLPSPTMPLMDNSITYIYDAILIAILSFVISISMAKMFAAKNKYTIDADQELRAYGLSHIFGSFFQSFAGAQAPPRSLVHVAAGGKTQLASIFSAVLVVLSCTVAAPLVEPLPKAVLASVIVVALFPLFKVFLELPTYWRTGRYDLFVWLITWSTTTFVSVTGGLVIGMSVSCLTVIAQTRVVKGYRLRRTDNGVWLRADRYKRGDATPVEDDFFVFRYPSMIYFANIGQFIDQLFSTTINPTSSNASSKGTEIDTTLRHRLVVVDCCEVSYVDTMFLNRVFAIRSNYESCGVDFVLACVNRTVVSRLNKVADELGVQRMKCYVHVEDAVVVHGPKATEKKSANGNMTRL